MPTVNVQTIAGQDSYVVDQDTIDKCLEQLSQPDAVLRIDDADDADGTTYFPVRHVIEMFVVGGSPE
ncbi:hypothetical protein ACIA5D_36950 [Actinoplanes sp. NPDC051513]|uniref:hypothetical protein n=1 Tax=Actinoplanes sp. NPDC051513 TaxID=3363908 RepID=UPI0037922368